MAEVILKNIKKVYPHQEPAKKKKGSEEKKTNLQITDEGVLAVQEFSLNIADKEFIVLVGPSGCGKSTPLRMSWNYGKDFHPLPLFGDRQKYQSASPMAGTDQASAYPGSLL